MTDSERSAGSSWSPRQQWHRRDLVSVCPRKTHKTQVPHRADGIQLFVWAGTGQQTWPLWSGGTMPQSSCLFSLSPFLLSQITKLENNRRVGPAFLCDLDRELFPQLPVFKKGLPGFRPGSKRPHLPWHSRSSYGISFGLTLGTNTQMYCSSLISRKSCARRRD